MLSDNYNYILQENIELKQRIKFLENKEISVNQLYTDIINKMVDINDLKQENLKLKNKIIDLENNINELN